MYNHPMLNGKYLGAISSDFVKVAPRIKEASYLVRQHGFSQYPIFPTTRAVFPLGTLLVEKAELENQWNYYVAYLDLFVQGGFVAKEKIGSFKKAYKDPDECCCLFVLDVACISFLYIPYPEDAYFE